MNVSYLKLFGFLFAFICTGCATLPGTISLSEQERKDAGATFKSIIGQQASCPCCLDADVSVTFQKMLVEGTLPGYLQAMAPSFMKFEGVNPFGMTETVLTTDGLDFTFVNVRQQKGYLGKVDSQKLKSYSPYSFHVSAGFYWLIGRFPPGDIEILTIEGDVGGGGYWADVRYEKGEKRSLVLFGSQNELIYQNISLNRDGDVLARFSYEYNYSAGQEEAHDDIGRQCLLPDRVIIDRNGNGTLKINFNKKYPVPEFSENDFVINIPNSFEREIFK
jgi:hypothetical protein